MYSCAFSDSLYVNNIQCVLLLVFPNKSVAFLLFLVSKLFVPACLDASSTQAKSISVMIHCEIMLTLLDSLTTFVHLKIVSFTLSKLCYFSLYSIISFRSLFHHSRGMNRPTEVPTAFCCLERKFNNYLRLEAG